MGFFELFQAIDFFIFAFFFGELVIVAGELVIVAGELVIVVGELVIFGHKKTSTRSLFKLKTQYHQSHNKIFIDLYHTFLRRGIGYLYRGIGYVYRGIGYICRGIGYICRGIGYI